MSDTAPPAPRLFVSYAQNQEDVLLWRALQQIEAGFYIDVGANDPELHSVTQAFYERGWHGMNLEPLLQYQARFAELRPRDINLMLAAGSSDSDITLYDVPTIEGWATLDASVAEQYRQDGHAVRECTVPVRRLDQLCQQYVTGPIHFLKVDVEGFEAEVLRGMDFVRWRPWIVLVEAMRPNSRDSNHHEWETLLLEHDYRFANFDGLNRYYVAAEHPALLEVLRLPVNVFDAWISWHLDRAWAANQHIGPHVAHLEQQAASALAAQQQLQQQLTQITASLSWRITAPLRWLNHQLRQNLRQLPQQLLQQLLHGIKQLAKRSLLWAARQPVLQRQVRPRVAAHFPQIESRLQQTVAQIRQDPVPPPFSPAEAALPEPVRRLPLSARKILAELTRPATADALQAKATNADVSTPTRHKPRLAYISPLPPQPSGIADYSAALIPELAREYEVVVIIEQDTLGVPWISANLPVHDVAWFRQHAGQFERILYHFGNSLMHRHMFDLFDQHPGIVVLHDFFLGNILEALTNHLGETGLFARSLYRSHGWHALAERQKQGDEALSWHYPCNKMLLDLADGVIVHSNFPKQLAEQWYGSVDNWRVIPLLRTLPAASASVPSNAERKAAARAQLGLAPDAFLVCSFGLLGPTKLNPHLLAAFSASALAQQPNCQLVFVGACPASDWGKQLAEQIANPPAGQTPGRITGFVSAEDYALWLQAADVAVQLRTQSRGETSAAVLDCLLYGVPTIVNAHGSSAELPTDCVISLTDACPLSELAAALEQLWRDDAMRLALGQRGIFHAEQVHAAPAVLAQYRDAIEHFAQHSPNARLRQEIAKVRQAQQASGAAVEPTTEPTTESTTESNTAPTTAAATDLATAPPVDLAASCALASELATFLPAQPPRQCLIDISALIQIDLRTGIQRVVRAILLALIDNPPAGYRIEPVFNRAGDAPFHYARSYMAEHYGLSGFDLPDAPVELRPGDMFLGLDLLLHDIALNAARLEDMRKLGVELVFVVYDLLPLLRPDVFPPPIEPTYLRWIDTVGRLSHGLLCISQAVAHEVQDWLGQHPVPRAEPLPIGYFHLGADIDASHPTLGLPDNAPQILTALKQRPTILMVGTVEPRKGQNQALAAFDLLWQQRAGCEFGDRRQARLDGRELGATHRQPPGTRKAAVLANRHQ